MLLYKPSDNTSSDSIEFWYIPKDLGSVPRHSNFKQPQHYLGENPKTPQKRPKQRTAEQDESTGKSILHQAKPK